MMKMTVIKVTRDGKTGYIQSPTLFGSRTPIVDNPVEARNYSSAEFEGKLEHDLDLLKLPNKEYVAMSGVPVDTAHVVELELTFTEFASKEISFAAKSTTKPKI